MKKKQRSYNSTIPSSSKKRKVILDKEAVQLKIMLEQSNGMCWICGIRKATEKSHTRDRKKFVPTCRECHTGNDARLGAHRYLEDIGEDK